MGQRAKGKMDSEKNGTYLKGITHPFTTYATKTQHPSFPLVRE